MPNTIWGFKKINVINADNTEYIEKQNLTMWQDIDPTESARKYPTVTTWYPTSINWILTGNLILFGLGKNFVTCSLPVCGQYPHANMTVWSDK